MTTMQKAFALVEGISKALASGTVHTDKAGKRLKTVHEVLRCLRDEKVVWLSNPDGSKYYSDCGIPNLGGEVAAEMAPTPTPTHRP